MSTRTPAGAPADRGLAEAVRQGPVVLDGGLATSLEARGNDLGGGLWSARLLLTADGRTEVAAVHRAFLDAGAQVTTTASYQLSALSLERAGRDPSTADALLRSSVSLAVAVRDEHAPGTWVAGSLGPYGASLANGSEYTGDHALGDHAAVVTVLRRFHRPRIEALLDAGADVLACETVPSAAEVEALAEELTAAGSPPAWVSLTPAPGGLATRRGEPLADALAPLGGLPLVAVGVNCCAPADVAPALRVAASATGAPGVAYPNSGEAWDASAQSWFGDPRWDLELVPQWVGGGAGLVGGCCRVGPDQVALVRSSLTS